MDCLQITTNYLLPLATVLNPYEATWITSILYMLCLKYQSNIYIDCQCSLNPFMHTVIELEYRIEKKNPALQ